MGKKAAKSAFEKMLSEVDKLSADEVRELDQRVRERMRETYNIPGIKVDGYISKDLAGITKAMISYAYKKGYIPKESIYSFTSWAVKLALLKLHKEATAEIQEMVEEVLNEEANNEEVGVDS